MRLRNQITCLSVIVLCAVAATDRLSADESNAEQPRLYVQRQGKLLKEIADGKTLERIEGIKKISGPWLGKRGEVVPDTLSILDARFNIETRLGEHDLLVALQKYFLSRYFSGPQIKVISSEFHYPGSSFSVIYYEAGWLGQFTLSLRDADGGFKAWIVDNSQAQQNLNKDQIEGIDVKNMLESSKQRREEDRREAEERIRAAKEKTAQQDGGGQPATRSESK